MKKRLILVISVLLIVAMSISVFVGCAASSDILKFLKDNPVETSKIILDELAFDISQYTIESANSTKNGLVLKSVATPTQYAIYSVADKTISGNKFSTSPTKFNSVWQQSITDANNVTIINIIDVTGATIFSTANSLNITVFNTTAQKGVVAMAEKNTFYYFKDGKSIDSTTDALNTSLFANTLLAEYSTVFAQDIILQYNASQISLYNVDNFRLQQSINIDNLKSENTQSVYVGLLDNKTCIVQIANMLVEDAEDYDFSIQGRKMNLNTYIVDIVGQKTKEVKFDYYIKEDICNKQTMQKDYPSKFENFTYASKINKKNLMLNTDNIVAFDNNLNVKFVGDGKWDNMEFVGRISFDKYLFSSLDKSYVVNLEGDIVYTYGSDLINYEVVFDVGFRLPNGRLQSFDDKEIVNLKNDEKFVGAFKEITFMSKDITVIDPNTSVPSTKTLYFRADRLGQIVEVENFVPDSALLREGLFKTVDPVTKVTTIYDALLYQNLVSEPGTTYSTQSIDGLRLFVSQGRMYKIGTEIFIQ